MIFLNPIKEKYKGEIIATYKIDGITCHINDKNIKGKSRLECIEDANSRGKYKLIYASKEESETAP